jgi:tetratricopeptide (TPR) repeat protein
MKITYPLVFLFCSIFCCQATAQIQLFEEAFESFSTSSLWAFEEIDIEWKMEGIIQADLNEGHNHLLENNPGLADVSLTTVIKNNSTIWQAYYYRAVARKQMRKFSLAEADMQRALKLRGRFYEGFVELAKILHLSLRKADSENAIQQAIRLDASRGAAHHVKGDMSMSWGEINTAIDSYTQCLAVDNLFHDARIKLALLDIVINKKEDSALQHLSTVLSYDSLQQNALLFRAILSYGRDKNQALKDLTNLVRISPDNLVGIYYRGLVQADLRHYERAFADFQKVIKATATNDNNFVGRQTWMDKKIDMQNVGAYLLTRIYGLSDEDAGKIKEAYCHIITGRYRETHEAIDGIFNYKKEPVAVYLKAVAFEHQGAHAMALDYYSRALKLDDQIGDAYKKRGIYEQELKEWDKSIEDFTAVLKLYPSAFRINWIRGLSYYHSNRFADAIADFTSFLKNDSTNKEVLGARGMAYFQSGKPLLAYVDFAASENKDALNYKHMELLVDSVLVRQDTTLALYCLGIITKHAPFFSEGFVQKFKIHLARNQWEPIAEDLSAALENIPTDLDRSKRSYLLTVQAMMHARDKHKEIAMKSFNAAINVDAANGLAYLERGRLFLEMRKSSKAESDFKKALSLGNEQAKELLAGLSLR